MEKGGVLTGEVLTVNSTCAVYTRTHVLACTYFQAPKVPQDLVCFSVRGACIYLRLGKRVHLTNAVMPALKNTTLDGQNREQVSGTLVLEPAVVERKRRLREREPHHDDDRCVPALLADGERGSKWNQNILQSKICWYTKHVRLEKAMARVGEIPLG